MVENKFKRMLCQSQGGASTRMYQINHRTQFEENVKATEDDIQKCLLFCWDMTYGKGGEHRDHRTGGIKRRNLNEIFQDIFIGKMGEIAFYRWCRNRGKAEISEVDFDCFALGEWDSSDFMLKGSKGDISVAVKTTKSFGNLLLLEKKDWSVIDDKAIYIPNKDKNSNGFYDYIIFCRVETNLNEIIKFRDMGKVSLNSLMESLMLKLQVVGQIRNEELVTIINSGKYEIYQGDILNNKTVMDADNYYVQSGAFVLPK